MNQRLLLLNYLFFYIYTYFFDGVNAGVSCNKIVSFVIRCDRMLVRLIIHWATGKPRPLQLTTANLYNGALTETLAISLWTRFVIKFIHSLNFITFV